MEELNKVVLKSLQKMDEAGTIKGIIEKKITGAVESTLEEIFRPYSTFSKNLKEYLENTLKVDFTHIGLEGYNDIVLKIVQKKIDENLVIVGREKIQEAMGELLQTPAKEIKLSELVEQLKADEFEYDDTESCTCIVEFDDKREGRGTVYLDVEPKKEKRNCDYQIWYSKDGVWNVKINEYMLKKQLFTGPFFGFERTLFQMYAAKIKLIVDEDNVDTSYPERN